jgi:hypothetical protein
LLVSAVITALCINTTFYTGPISAALGGADISPFVGVILGAGLYALLAGRTVRAQGEAVALAEADRGRASA